MIQPNPYSCLNQEKQERRKIPVRRVFYDLNLNLEGQEGGGGPHAASAPRNVQAAGCGINNMQPYNSIGNYAAGNNA